MYALAEDLAVQDSEGSNAKATDNNIIDCRLRNDFKSHKLPK